MRSERPWRSRTRERPNSGGFHSIGLAVTGPEAVAHPVQRFAEDAGDVDLTHPDLGGDLGLRAPLEEAEVHDLALPFRQLTDELAHGDARVGAVQRGVDVRDTAPSIRSASSSPSADGVSDVLR